MLSGRCILKNILPNHQILKNLLTSHKIVPFGLIPKTDLSGVAGGHIMLARMGFRGLVGGSYYARTDGRGVGGLEREPLLEQNGQAAMAVM